VFYFLSAFVVFSSFDRSFSHPCMFMFTVFTKIQNITSTTLPSTAQLPTVSLSHPERHPYQLKFPDSNGLKNRNCMIVHTVHSHETRKTVTGTHVEYFSVKVIIHRVARPRGWISVVRELVHMRKLFM